MEAKDIFGRMVSSNTGVPFSEMDRSGLHDRKKQHIVSKALSGMAELPLFFSDTAQCTIHDIRAKAEQLKQRHGLDMLLLDYLQLVEETDKYRSREQGIAQISRGLKMLAMNLEIPVIALSQLNRESEHRADKRPTMADLRESGAIEQDADSNDTAPGLACRKNPQRRWEQYRARGRLADIQMAQRQPRRPETKV